MFLLTLILLAFCSDLFHCETDLGETRPDSVVRVVDTCQALKEEAQAIRREGYSAVDKADLIREQAYRVKDEAFELKDEAYEIKESAMEARSALETTLVETLALMRSQATATNLYVQEIRTTLSSFSNRMDKLEQNLGQMEEKLEKIDQKVDDRVSEVTAKISETQTTAATILNRQQAWISEIRLISLYKVTEENNRHGQGYDSDLVTDGMFIRDRHGDNSMRTYVHTRANDRNNKIWIELGGVFRIHKIKIWNLRHCCQDQLVGSHIYADDKLIGTIIEALITYDFTLSDDDPTYASRITLHQPLAKHLHILELQVWGNGPFQRDDKFA